MPIFRSIITGLVLFVLVDMILYKQVEIVEEEKFY
ncbi:MAG: hypothetical protein JWQ09_4537 [Segetibacter sp.]|nr:hypothetical protein [Segetibacter sp.]